MNKNKIINVILVVGVCLVVVGFSMLGIKKYREYKEAERIRNAIIKVELNDNLNINFNSDVYVMDLITSINGTIIDNYKIDTTKLGIKDVTFKFINEENIKVPYTFKINVVDVIPPVIWLGSTYSVKVGYSKKLEDVIMCGDDYDDTPNCYIEGEYDLNKIGKYPLTYNAVDNSGNATSKTFTLNVYKTSSGSSSNSKKVYFNDVIKKYKTDKTKIGIDVSKWQGTIDYNKVKDAGVEFVFIKLGGSNGIDGDYYLDPKFKENIEGFTSVGIPFGVYFYTYANSIEKSREDALWVVEQLKDYKIDLPIAYDWENWSSYNKFKMSFNTLTRSAEMFIETVNKHGYQGLLYSSKSYLEQIWLKGNYRVWLAHYTDKTNYQGNYDYWQMTSSGVVDGITENTVDIDIMYLD